MTYTGDGDRQWPLSMGESKPFREQEKFAGLPAHVYSYVDALEQRVERLERAIDEALRYKKRHKGYIFVNRNAWKIVYMMLIGGIGIGAGVVMWISERIFYRAAKTPYPYISAVVGISAVVVALVW
jgi:hypothetical protein